jgi:protein-tyrosine phosphatase
MAEGLMRHQLLSKGINARVDSAGTSRHHSGEAPDQRAIRCMQSHGIDIEGLRARQVATTDLQAFDFIFAMDRANLSYLRALPGAEAHTRIYLMMEVVNAAEADVPDPWYGQPTDFETVYQMLQQACALWIPHLMKPAQ